MRGGENIKKVVEEKVGRGEKLEVSGKDGERENFHTTFYKNSALCARFFLRSDSLCDCFRDKVFRKLYFWM